jgi:diguanylate cyclase (GGDEF)-like protein
MRDRPTFALFTPQMEFGFIVPLWQEAIKVAQEKDFNLIICNGRVCNLPYLDHMQENVAYDTIAPEKIDGIVIYSAMVLSAINKDEQKSFVKKYAPLPVISVGLKIEDTYSLLLDNKKGIKELVRHLIEQHNRKKIAFLKGRESSEEAQARFDAYIETLGEYGLPVNEELIVPGNFLGSDGVDAVRILLDERKVSFDALVCANDYMALAACDEFIRRGLSVPDDISITGFDNVPQAQTNMPSLTTVDQPLHITSRMAFEWMYNLVINGAQQEEKLRFVPNQVFIRETCGCVPLLQKFEQADKPESGLDMNTNRGKGLLAELFGIFKIKEKEQHGLKTELEHLVFQFQTALKTKEQQIFLKPFYKFLVKEILYDDEEVLSTAFFNMKLLLIRDLTKTEEKTWCESLFYNAQMLLRDIILLQRGYKQSQLGDMYYRFKIFTQAISTVTNLNELLNITASTITDLNELLNIAGKNISALAMDRCFITLYKDGNVKRKSKLAWEIPEHSQLVMMTNKKQMTVYQGDGPVFASKEILPGELFYNRKEHFIWVIRPLYSREMHFGNIIFSGALIDGELYDTLHGVICTGLMSVYLLEERAKHTALLEEHRLQLEAANEKLTELDRMKTNFIQNITHEFRSPLSIIMNSADLALKYDKLLDSQLKSRFNIIYNATLRLNANIDKLLDLAKMDSHKMQLHIAPVNLNYFLTEVVDFYKSVASISHIRIESELDNVKGISDFYSDQDKLEDVINNIFSNALKFVDQKRGKIVVKTECSEKSILITIKDNGVGIEKDQLDKIFERFVQSDSGRNSRFKGTGIGLSFAQQLMVLLKGRIWAESEGENKGTTFFLEFPRGKEVFPPDAVEDEPVSNIDAGKREKMKLLIQSEIGGINAEQQQIEVMLKSLNKEAEFDYRKAIILIVEDNQAIMNIEEEYLEKAGYVNFLRAGNGKQGLEAIYRYHPDIVICDYNMPGMRGDQLHDTVYNDPAFKLMPFIFLTAINSKELIKERKEKGAIAFLVKPVEESDLVLTVDTHLKRYMSLKESLYLSRVDSLTGLANKKTLHNALTERVMLRKYYHLSLVFFDIDHFKIVNDTYGHQTGDEVLMALGKIIADTKRDYDIAGRYGGEEFLLLLPETNQKQALEVAKKIKSIITAMEIKTEKGTLKITVSCGISSLIDNSRIIESLLKIQSLEDIYNISDVKAANWEEIDKIKVRVGETLLKLSDKALYEAKNDYCGSCGYMIKDNNQPCPICHASDIRAGRDRIVLC